MSKTTIHPIGWLLGLTLWTAACQQPAYKEPIAKFQESTEAATAAIEVYYSELNGYERELYLLERLVDPKKEILDLRKTPLLTNPFDPKAIQVRVALLQQLANYAEHLSTLAGNDAPKRFRANTTTLAGNLTALQNTFTKLNSPTGTDKAAKDYVGPLGTIAGIIGEAATARKRDKALKKAIIDGEAPINRLFAFLERDFRKYVVDTRVSGSLQKLTELVNAYNQVPKRNTVPRDERRQLLLEIEQAADEYRIIQETQPADIVKAMREAHQALVKLAKDTNPTTLNSLLSTLEAYNEQVEALTNAALELEELHTN